jgi:hypothetical protein
MPEINAFSQVKLFLVKLAKNIYMLFVHVFFYALTKSLPFKKKPKKKYDLAICACFKNEAHYLQEWIEYHRLIGVDHFYLFNNESEDAYQAILKKYISEGIVTIKDFPGKGIQFDVYRSCILQHHQEVTWLAMIDLDEFICLKYDFSGKMIWSEAAQAYAVKSEVSISQWLDQFSHYPVLKIWWKQFGSSGLIQRDLRGLVIEDFTFCEADGIAYNYTKCILNMHYWDQIDPAGIHDFKTTFCLGLFSLKIAALNVAGFFDGFAKRFRPVQINHYTNKSYDEYVNRKMRNGRADHIVRKGEVPVPLESFHWVDHRSTERDFSIQRFLTQLKLRLSKG